MRGGVSECKPEIIADVVSSPRAWGCFHPVHEKTPRTAVFPTCVGVFLRDGQSSKELDSLPHVRGGVSTIAFVEPEIAGSSPRAWGCFSPRVGFPCVFRVFPTCVGVFLYKPTPRGGQPVFPTCVGVFPTFFFSFLIYPRLPHVRGGVSKRLPCPSACLWSSPRAWGCFFRRYASGQYTAVFPTCVGVFLQTVIKLVLAAVFPTCVGVFLILVWCS